MRRFLPSLPFVPLLLSGAPRSFLAHDEGYYALQARWALEQHEWLTPLWLGSPAFDRTMTLQWLIALAYRLFGLHPWVAHLPSLAAATASLWLTHALARELAPKLGLGTDWPWLSTLVLACTPLWLNYAHLATQDLPLLAVEELALLALLRSTTNRPDSARWSFLAGACVGLGFLLKSFLIAVPLLALAPYLLIERRSLLRRRSLWTGVLAGALPAVLWLGLALQGHGLAVVSGLWLKLVQLSGSDHFQPGPFFYLWNLPANTAPWIVAAGWGWWQWSRPQAQGGLERAERLLLLVSPALLLLLLSAFRTKTPYYGLLLCPWLALAAAAALMHWSAASDPRRQQGRRWLAAVGAVVLLAALSLRWIAPELSTAIGLPLPIIGAAGLGLGVSWGALPISRRPRQRLAAMMVGPWLVLVLLVQGGLFSDRTPALRQALEQPQLQHLLHQEPIQLIAAAPLSDDDQVMVILLGLATPRFQATPIQPSELPAGRLAWSRTTDLLSLPIDRSPRRLLQPSPNALGSWQLVQGR
ncbi:MAG: ArnT family glycosyltransferase [Cyanobacteriota bacterium]